LPDDETLGFDCVKQVPNANRKKMRKASGDRRRSWCPISTALEILGDRWSLLIVRDLMYAGFQTYKELLSSDEGIATNVLADRLAHLVTSGIVTSERDPSDGRRVVYRLTPKGSDLAPVILELGIWGVKHEGGVGPFTRRATPKGSRLAASRGRGSGAPST